MDMDSTFTPMVKYLENLNSDKIIVEKLENIGPRLLWSHSRFVHSINNNGFFLTDGDIDLSETSNMVFDELVRISLKYKYFKKVGCALRIDNLPIYLNKSRDIIDSEIDNWSEYRSIAQNAVLAPIDTTLAFYPSYTQDFYHWPAVRLSGKNSIMHKPWYVDYENLTPEEAYYIEKARGWGGFGTSAERGKRPEDNDFTKTLLYRYSRAIKFILLISPKFGSLLITKLINSRNLDSVIKTA